MLPILVSMLDRLANLDEVLKTFSALVTDSAKTWHNSSAVTSAEHLELPIEVCVELAPHLECGLEGSTLGPTFSTTVVWRSA